MRGKAPDLDAWTAHNPFELAQMTLGNFAGERDAPDAARWRAANGSTTGRRTRSSICRVFPAAW